MVLARHFSPEFSVVFSLYYVLAWFHVDLFFTEK